MAPAIKGLLKTPVILLAANSLVALSAMGFLVYSKMLYKRAPITEGVERVRLADLHANPTSGTERATIVFEPITVNIESIPGAPAPADGTSRQIQGKLHYATVGFALEIRDQARQTAIEGLRPLILDRFLSILGRKSFRELTTVQGRYLVRTQLLDAINELALERLGADFKEGPLTNIYFTEFIVQ